MLFFFLTNRFFWKILIYNFFFRKNYCLLNHINYIWAEYVLAVKFVLRTVPLLACVSFFGFFFLIPTSFVTIYMFFENLWYLFQIIRYLYWFSLVSFAFYAWFAFRKVGQLKLELFCFFSSMFEIIKKTLIMKCLVYFLYLMIFFFFILENWYRYFIAF